MSLPLWFVVYVASVLFVDAFKLKRFEFVEIRCLLNKTNIESNKIGFLKLVML